MKKNYQEVPAFDEIIFENRNKSYGAFNIRKSYGSSAIVSLISGVILFSIPFILAFIFPPQSIKAVNGPDVIVIVKPLNLIDPGKVPEPAAKPVPVIPKQIYVAPKVVDDTTDLSTMLTNDVASQLITNGEVPISADSMTYVTPSEEVNDDPDPVISVEEPPVFPGGEPALLKYIAENTKYPPEALENNIQGKVFVKFAVAPDGSVKRIEVMRSVNPLLDEEAKRVISTLPAWKPGRQNGKAVSVWFFVPVTFRINN
jgi:periplasmic protein TonB